MGCDGDNTKRSFQRENEAAAVLAARGYLVFQNPSAEQVADARAQTGDTGRPTANPDYLVEGRVFDCYAPFDAVHARNAVDETGETCSVMIDKEQIIRRPKPTRSTAASSVPVSTSRWPTRTAGSGEPPCHDDDGRFARPLPSGRSAGCGAP